MCKCVSIVVSLEEHEAIMKMREQASAARLKPIFRKMVADNLVEFGDWYDKTKHEVQFNTQFMPLHINESLEWNEIKNEVLKDNLEMLGFYRTMLYDVLCEINNALIHYSDEVCSGITSIDEDS